MKSLSLKKVSDGQVDIHIPIKYVFLFLYSIIFFFFIIRSQKNWCGNLKLKFILMFFDSVYPARPSDTLTKYTV